MPQFLFAVGFGMRLSWLRRREQDGPFQAYRHFFGRCLSLLLLGIVVYHLTGKYATWAELTAKPWGEILLFTFKRQPFETLVHIAVTSIWVLPVLAAPGWVRALFALASAALHVGISFAGYYDWNLAAPAGIDGGPLGYLTWTLPLITGTLAHDAVQAGAGTLSRCFLGAFVLMACGIALSFVGNPTATWPFIKPDDTVLRNYWLMSQRAGSVTYLLFGAGFSLLVYALCRLIADDAGYAWGGFSLFSRHALAGYVLHGMVSDAVRPFVPRDAPVWYIVLAVAIYLGILTMFIRYLERHRLFFRL